MIESKLDSLARRLKGDLFYDETLRKLYATDASAYREIPIAVAIPKSIYDLKELIRFATIENTSLIPRTAGTSLAGQVVGNGIVVDVSEYFTEIIEVNKEKSYAVIQPGVIRDNLNAYLKQYGLFFGPETSTSNRCMIGGMVGNNSCGARSLIYGSTREHIISLKAILADGNEVEFKDLNEKEFEEKANGIGNTGELETSIYKKAKEILSYEFNRKEIEKNYPKTSIPRRNTGYALDILGESSPFSDTDIPFNFCKLIAGSEGTLAFITEIKINLVPLLPPNVGVLALHFNSIDEALKANIETLKYGPTACELMDHYILDCTKENLGQKANRFFVEGEPKAILVVEFAKETSKEIDEISKKLINELKEKNLGYHYPLIVGEEVSKVWDLRKAGLGLLSNIPGDAKAVAVIEDTAVDVIDLPDYIHEFNNLLTAYGLYAVHYAHAATGELHLRPIIDLKTKEGNELYRKIATEVAQLVKKYNGSLSGEHGDGRLRGEFIPFMLGEHNYKLCQEIKKSWDPNNIFNPGKIVDTPPMNTSLRYMPGYKTPEFQTIFNFSKNNGILRAAENCNGSGDCRKTEISGGTMCPSYMATKKEKHNTRARANILREVLTSNEKKNKFDSEQIKEVMDLCISCKGCKSECPSNVDVSKLKAEFTYQYRKSNKSSSRDKRFANYTKLNEKASKFPRIYNFLVQNSLSSGLIKKIMGIAPQRSLPVISKTTLKNWYKNYQQKGDFKNGLIYLFADEFTNYNDAELGKKTILLLNKIGYEVCIPHHLESGRSFFSKGYLDEAKDVAVKNIQLLSKIISSKTPLIGIEPSAILSFRDEYIDIVPEELIEEAKNLAKNTFLIEEFLEAEFDKGKFESDLFTDEAKTIRLHGHCHQKALSNLKAPKRILSIPKNYKVLNIPSGCCGMAGSFGYEKEHYEVSMKIGELVLFPTIRKEAEKTIIAAPGTSCRHQIKDGINRSALHPAEILWDALI